MIFVLEFIMKLLEKEKVTLAAPIKLSDCKITRKYLLDRAEISDGTAIMLAIPYLSRNFSENHNISAYCAPRDYHLFFKYLFDKIIPILKEKYPKNKFCGFADHSPLDERDAAVAAGLGVIGKNGMLITEKYSSYVFLGELITDAIIPCEPKAPSYCMSCGKCLSFCPMGEIGDCLSAVTQKKGELSDAEKSYLIKYGTVWGCDICQEVCPHTEKAKKSGTIYTDIDFFNEDVVSLLTKEKVEAYSDEEFEKRAFSWRGRNVILRNLEIAEKK